MKTKYRLCQRTSHSSLLVALQGDVSHKLNQALLLVYSFDSNFLLLKNDLILNSQVRVILCIFTYEVSAYENEFTKNSQLVDKSRQCYLSAIRQFF